MDMQAKRDHLYRIGKQFEQVYCSTALSSEREFEVWAAHMITEVARTCLP